MKVIGLTGGIATGKSAAIDYLKRQYQVPSIDIDQIGHQLLKRGQLGYGPVVAAFGQTILGPDSQIDRQRLGEVIFAEPREREKLNAILHPLILKKSEKALDYLRSEGRKVAIVSAALILEEGLEGRFDDLIILISDPALQIKRLVDNRQMSESQAGNRVESQWDNNQRLAYSNYFTIQNDQSLAEFEMALEQCWRQLANKHQF